MSAVLVTVLLLAGCGGPPTVDRTPGSAADRSAAMLNGLYVIEWTGPVTHTGVPVDLGLKPNDRNAWAFRSACDDDGCVATGGGIAEPDDMTAPLAAVHVGDYSDGHWSITWLSGRKLSCTGADGTPRSSPAWTHFDIADDLTMTATLVGTGDCPFIDVRRPVLTRIDDSLRGVPLPDPAGQPRRVAPVGAGFTGEYTVTRTPRGGGAEQTTTREVATHCLRTERRCVTTSVNDEAQEFSVLEFDRDAFGRRAAAVKQPCATGGDGVAEVTETLRPAQIGAPLRSVSGERTTTFIGGCTGITVDDVTYVLAND